MESSNPPGLLHDLSTALSRVIRGLWPIAPAQVGAFVSDELIGNTVGWSAGLMAGWLVDLFFVKRGLRNLWGLAPGERTVVSGSGYEMLGAVASYAVGLLVLIFVRHFLVGTLRELRAVRTARATPGSSAS